MKFSTSIVSLLLPAVATVFAAPVTNTTDAKPTNSSNIVHTKWPAVSFSASDSGPLVPLFNSTGASPDVIAALNTIPFPRTLLSTLANAQGVFVGLAKILASSIDARSRELAITDWLLIACRVGYELDAAYVWNNNAIGLSLVGWNDTQINGIGFTIEDINAGAAPFFTHRHRIILNLIDEQLHQGRTNKISTINEALTILTVPELVEAIIMIGAYTTFSGAVRSLRIAQDSTFPGIEDVFRGILTSDYKIYKQE